MICGICGELSLWYCCFKCEAEGVLEFYRREREWILSSLNADTQRQADADAEHERLNADGTNDYEPRSAF